MPFGQKGGGGNVTADAVLDLAKPNRSSADRGKRLGTSETDENALALGAAPIRKWVNNDVGTDAENIASNLHDDDWITVNAEGTGTGGSSTPEVDTFSRRFGDVSGTERLILGLGSQAAAVLVTKSGSSLQARRGNDLTAASTIVYAERRSYSVQTI